MQGLKCRHLIMIYLKLYSFPIFYNKWLEKIKREKFQKYEPFFLLSVGGYRENALKKKKLKQ